jgi:hypothetical protein
VLEGRQVDLAMIILVALRIKGRLKGMPERLQARPGDIGSKEHLPRVRDNGGRWALEDPYALGDDTESRKRLKREDLQRPRTRSRVKAKEEVKLLPRQPSGPESVLRPAKAPPAVVAAKAMLSALLAKLAKTHPAVVAATAMPPGAAAPPAVVAAAPWAMATQTPVALQRLGAQRRRLIDSGPEGVLGSQMQEQRDNLLERLWPVDREEEA